MSKRQRKHNLVGGILAAAVVAAVAIGGQLSGIDNSQLATNAICYGPNYTADCPANSHDQAACVGAGYLWQGNDCFPVGGDAGGGTTSACQALNNRSVTTAECTAANTAKLACVAPSIWDGTTGSGTCTGGGTTSACQALNNRSVTTAECTAANTAKLACVAPSIWNGTTGSGTCTAGASSYTTEATCKANSFFWYNNVCNNDAQAGGGGSAASTKTNQTDCTGAGYFWSSTKNTCYSTQLEKTTAESVVGGGSIPAGTCPDGYAYLAGSYPNGPCVGHESVIGGGGAASTKTNQTDCVGAGYFWSSTKNTCYSTQLEKTNAETVVGGNAECTQDQIMKLGQGCHIMDSGYFNGEMTKYIPYSGTTVKDCTTSPVQGCTGSAAPATNKDSASTACGYNQYWDQNTNSCVLFPTNIYREDYQYDVTKKDPAYWGRLADKMAGEAGCEASNWYWDPKGHGGTGDCFPQKPSAFGMNQPTMGKIPFGMTGTPAEPTYDYGTQWTNFEDFKGGYSQDMEWCDTPQGRADPGCWYETEGEFDFLSEFKEGGEATERDRDMLDKLREEIDFVTAKTNGAYCKGIEKAEEVYTKAYENPAFLAGVGPEMQRVFEALHQCEGKIQVLQNLEQLARKLSSLKVSAENEEAKADLVARVAAYQEDPTPLLDFEAGPDGMRKLWEAFEMLRGNGRQFEAEMGSCIQLEYMQSDIERWTAGDTTGMEGAPPMDDKSFEMADKALVMIDDALAKGDKKACKLVLRDLERMGQEMGMSEDGPRFYDRDQMMMQNIYGDDIDFSSLKAELLAELKEQLLGTVKKLIEDQMAIVREQLKIAFLDFESRISESAILSKVTAQMSAAGEKLDSDVGEKISTIFTERVSYYPLEFHEKAEANREIAVELLEPIFESVPEDLIKEAGLDDKAELIYTELLTEDIAENIAPPELILQVQNTIASSIDSDGKVKADKEAALVRMLTEVADHIDEQTKDLEKEQEKEGLRPLDKFTDKDEIADWGIRPLEGAIFAGEANCEPVIKGEGDGSMNPSGELLGAHVYTMIDRILCTDGNKSEVAGLTSIDWAAEPAAALRDLGVIDDEDIKTMAETMNRGETISTLVKSMAAADGEMRKAVDEAPWVLKEAGLSEAEAVKELGSEENAKAANFAYATGMMTGQTGSDGTKDLDFDGQFNRLQSVKVSAVGMGVMNTVKEEGADALLDTIEENFIGGGPGNFKGIIDPTYLEGDTSLIDPTF